MRILLAPAGTQGDFQPMLALAVGLRAAGHEAVVAAGECYRGECAAFGVPFIRAGVDVREVLQGRSRPFTPLRATLQLVRTARVEAAGFVRDLLEPCRNADLILGSGVQLAAPIAAEAMGKPYWVISFTPQVFPSAHHPPVTLPAYGLPPVGNRALWSLSNAMSTVALAPTLHRVRKELGLPRHPDLIEHVYPRRRALLACDPELAPPPADLDLPFPPTGSLPLEDLRPLPQELDRFLREGPPPVYLGFGSMPDPRPEKTTRLVFEAISRASCRAVVASGWAGLGSIPPPPGVKVIGSCSHALLLPRVAATVHHGGAGTAAASARAGKPQLVVPHAFDQIALGHHVARSGLGPPPIRRSRLTAARLADGLTALLRPEFAANSARVGEAIRERNAVGRILSLLETMAADYATG